MSIESLLAELDERTIARRIGIPHDMARLSYPLRSNTVKSFDEYNWIIGDYYNHHFTRCISHGGKLPSSEAASRAKEILEQEFRRRGGDIVMAYNFAAEGIEGGLRVQIDQIAEGLKAQSVERYVRHIFDAHVSPNSWEQKVEIIRQFIDQCGPFLSSSIQTSDVTRYARDFQDLIKSYLTALQNTSSIFRRL
jgi:hypothetical protein